MYLLELIFPNHSFVSVHKNETVINGSRCRKCFTCVGCRLNDVWKIIVLIAFNLWTYGNQWFIVIITFFTFQLDILIIGRTANKIQRFGFTGRLKFSFCPFILFLTPTKFIGSDSFTVKKKILPEGSFRWIWNTSCGGESQHQTTRE